MQSNDNAGKALLEAFVRLQATPEFQLVLEHVQAQRKAAGSDLLAAVEPAAIYRAQGAAMTLDNLLALAEGAQKRLNAVRDQADPRWPRPGPGAW